MVRSPGQCHGQYRYQQHAHVLGLSQTICALESLNNSIIISVSPPSARRTSSPASSRRRRARARGRRGRRRPSTTTCSCRRRRRSSPRTGARAARRRSSGRTSAILWKRPTSRTRAASPRTTPTSSARRRRRSRPSEDGRRAAPHSSPFWSLFGRRAMRFLICPRPSPSLPHVLNVLFCDIARRGDATDRQHFNSTILHAPGRKDGAEELEVPDVHAPQTAPPSMLRNFV